MKTKPAKTAKKALLQEKKHRNSSFPIVAIGASAGGFEAVTQLLQALPPDTGMAFIYIQHLSPDYKSMLASLLSKSTKMKVQEARNMTVMAPDNFYVIPPDKEMFVVDGKIKLIPRKRDHSANVAIDTFFISLADKHKGNAIGIVLSGNASDGTEGLKAIKLAGGLTFAQDKSAQFSSMPQSAIAAGIVDYVLSPKNIARELTRLSKNTLVKHYSLNVGKEDAINNHDNDLKLIFQLLQKETGTDFRLYKMNTIKRRIIRRMLLHNIKTVKQYFKQLLQNNGELNGLYQDLLINVTEFFRDSDAYSYLKSSLFPSLLKNKKPGETFRVWVPACSTGEEAYSIGILLLEILHNKPAAKSIQIFATDLSEKAINKARIGEYSAKEMQSVPPKYLHRYYTKINGSYRINKMLRDICVFAPHNLLRDPPFSRVDFISCRNLLIYLDSEAQKKALSTFHYALKENGYLMLGSSETIGTSQRLFSEINKKFKVYQKKKNVTTILPELTPRFTRPHHFDEKEQELPAIKKATTRVSYGSLDSAVDAVLLEQYIPASVVINYDMEILQFRGATSLYLEHASGKASLNVLKMVKPEIAFELRNAIQRAMKQKKYIRKTGIEMRSDSTLRIVSINIAPLNIDWPEPLLLVLFSEQAQEEVHAYTTKGSGNSAAKDRKIKKLQEEISAYRDDLRTITENHEAAIEELQSANEEIVSGNEELQTVNEELQTSKEEIQSTNEELATVNQELQTRNELLAESHKYSESIIATLHEPMMVLNSALIVKSANKAFYKKFKFTPENAEGYPIYELGNKQWNIPRLREMLEGIISKNTFLHNVEITCNFPGLGEKNLRLNANRLEQSNTNEHLILLAITDITDSVHKQEEIERMHKMHEEELELKNKALDDKNRELEKTNKELESFSYVSSHDLQEPLRKIRNFVICLLEEESHNLSGTGKDYLKKIQNTTKRMQQLIDDLLMYSRVTNDQHKLENCDLNLLMKKVAEDFKDSLQKVNGTITWSDLGFVNVIPFQVRQLMGNIISNAIKFASPKKKLRISVTSKFAIGSKLHNEKLSPQANYCHITVKDNGIGFDPHYKERIFEVFQRLHEYDQYKGSGIGLAICKKIVENHNGVITATGKLNEGAKFDIYIPVV